MKSSRQSALSRAARLIDKMEAALGERSITLIGDDDKIERRFNVLEEGHTKVVNGIKVRKDAPHFNGDDYHVHVQLPGGYELSWQRGNGTRRHPSKFPKNVSMSAKQAAAKILGVSVDLLECFTEKEEATGHDRIYMRLRKTKPTPQMMSLARAVMRSISARQNL